MRRVFAVCILAVVAAIAVYLFKKRASDAPSLVEVTGVVLDRSKKHAVSGIVIEFLAAKSPHVPSGVSDANGRFRIVTPGVGPGMPPGRYGVKSSKAPFWAPGENTKPPSPTDAAAYSKAMKSILDSNPKSPTPVQKRTSIEPDAVQILPNEANELVFYLGE